MVSPTSNEHFAKLAALYNTIDSLAPTSTPQEFETFAGFFSESCTTYLKSMREFAEPANGRATTIASLQEVLQQQQVVERHILSQVTTPMNEGETKVFVEMKNKLHVLGRTVDTFYETAVVTFDAEGLVKELRNYSCRSHVVETVQKETGEGPYSEGYLNSLKRGEEVAGCCG